MKLLVIGAGNMAEALFTPLEGELRNWDISFYTPSSKRAESLAKSLKQSFLHREEEWDKDMFTTCFPVVNPYPEQVLRHFLGQLSEVRELENEYGIDMNKIFDDVGNNNNTQTTEQDEQKLKSKGKYAVAAGLGGTAGAIVAVATN